MNANELIKQLEQLPSDAIVLFWHYDDEYAGANRYYDIQLVEPGQIHGSGILLTGRETSRRPLRKVRPDIPDSGPEPHISDYERYRRRHPARKITP